jgi:ADP-heptose:LPS heptosyltransferase
MLVAKLVRELRVAVIMFGSETDKPLVTHVQDFVKDFNGGVQGMHAAISPDPDNPSWPIRRSLATIQACDLVIGPDTGLMWGVAMEPVPKIMLLSHASPENITKHWRDTTTLHTDPERVPCWPCHQLHDGTETCRKAENVEASACIADISHETVYGHVRRLLCLDQQGARAWQPENQPLASYSPSIPENPAPSPGCLEAAT